MKLIENPFRSPRVAAVLAGALALIVYANSLENGFAFDDNHAIVLNESIHDLSELPDALIEPYWAIEVGRDLGIWRPATTALFGLEWALWDQDPLPYHALNVVAHGTVTAVATLVMAQLVPVGAAFVGGLVFAVHPVHVEAVANVVGVAEIMAALCMLLALLLFLRRRRDPGPGPGRIAAITGLYALGFLFKESAATLPALFVLVDAWRHRLRIRDLLPYARRRLGLYASMGGVAAVILVLRLRVLGSLASAFPPLGADILEEIPRIWTVAASWPHYVRLLFFPVDLIAEYSPAVIDIQFGWNATNLAGVVLVLSFLGLAWASWRHEPGGGGARAEAEEHGPAAAVTLGILWFGVALLPVANLLFLSGVLLAERTIYLPSVGFALAAGAVLWGLRRRARPAAAAVVVIAVALMGLRTWTANPRWDSTQVLFTHLLNTHPESGRVQWAFADHLFRDQDRPDEALDVYRLAVAINGTSYSLICGVAKQLISIGRYQQAANLARIAWRERPGSGYAPGLVAIALSNLGRHREVLEPGRASLAREPEDAVVHHAMATAYRELGMLDRALVHRKAAIAHGEGDQYLQWQWLGGLHLERGDSARAVATLDSARLRTQDEAAWARLDSLETLWSGGEARGPEGL